MVLCRSLFKEQISHEQVATLVLMSSLGSSDKRIQTTKNARPAMKLTSKEDADAMSIVCDWWTQELAPHRCWGLANVGNCGQVLIHFVNRPAGDYHALAAILNHQGSSCHFPCVFCECHDTTGQGRECAQCGRYSCEHTPLAAVHSDVMALKELASASCVAPQPMHCSKVVDSSHSKLQPRTTRPQAADKVAAVTSTPAVTASDQTATATKRGRSVQGGRGPKVARCTTGTADSGSTGTNGMSLFQPKGVFVHPDVQNNGRCWLRLPSVAKARTSEAMQRCGALAAYFGEYEQVAAKGRKLAYREVRRSMLEGGKLSADDMRFLENECTALLLEDGIITHDPHKTGAFLDRDGKQWTFPKHKGTSADGSTGWEAILKYCRKGLTGVPQAQTLRWDMLKPDALHTLLKCVALLADLAASLAFDLPSPVDLYALLERQYGLFKPVSGYDGSACRKWLNQFEEWSMHLRQHALYEHLKEAVTSMRVMLKTAMSKQPDVQEYCEAARRYHRTMLTHFCKTQFRIYEHIMLVHLPSILMTGTLLDGSSWFLEALNKTWKQALLHHTDCGGGKRGQHHAELETVTDGATTGAQQGQPRAALEAVTDGATIGARDDDIAYEDLAGWHEHEVVDQQREHVLQQSAGSRLRHSIAENERRKASIAHTRDLSAIKLVWLLTHPELLAIANEWTGKQLISSTEMIGR
jgi:hypothetical protein